MKVLLKDASLDGLKGSIQYCADYRKPSVHYRTTNGWPIWGMCGYNPALARFCEQKRSLSTANGYAARNAHNHLFIVFRSQSEKR
jgi:hypothetical protein